MIERHSTCNLRILAVQSQLKPFDRHNNKVAFYAEDMEIKMKETSSNAKVESQFCFKKELISLDRMRNLNLQTNDSGAKTSNNTCNNK